MWPLILLGGCGDELTVVVEGEGKVTSNPPGIDCPAQCTMSVSSGSQIQLLAVPAPGSVFGGWVADAPTEASALALTMDGPKTVIARMPKLHPLEVEIDGEGDATVKSTPAGIDCPGTCKTELAAGTKVMLSATGGVGTRVVAFEGACTGAACAFEIRGPSKVSVKTSGIPGTVIFAERIDDEAGAFAVDPGGAVLWGREGRLETYGTDGKRTRRSATSEAKIATIRSVSARTRDTALVAGDSEGGSAVAAIRSSGAPQWSVFIPGSVGGVRGWTKGVIVASTIEGVVELDDRRLGQKKKKDVLIVWLDKEGKITDSKLLGIAAEGPIALAADERGAAVVVMKGGKRHALHKVAGSDGQRWKVTLGELLAASVSVGQGGQIWVGGTALSVAKDLERAGIRPTANVRCDDAGFGFVVTVDAGGKVLSGKGIGRGIPAMALADDELTVALELVGNMETSTGTFTSAGYAAKLEDCDDKCREVCSAESDPGPCELCKTGCSADTGRNEEEAYCTTDPDILVGELDKELALTWARQLTAESEIRVIGVSAQGSRTTVAFASAERVRIVGGPREVSVPSGASMVRFR